MPDMLHSTSMRGRPSSSSGTSSKRATRPVPSVTGRAPTSSSTMPTLSPLVLMASRPHRLTATVSGSAPLFASACAWRICVATSAPRARAAAEGMRYGSSAWMLRPVGSTPSPSRNRSPPASGRTYSPASALRTASSSSVLRCSSARMSTARSSLASSAARCSALSGASNGDVAEAERNMASSLARTAGTPPLPASATAFTAASGRSSPKKALRYWTRWSRLGGAPSVWRPSLKRRFSTVCRYWNSSEQ
mmetsp:Transcript_8911/g.27048  ORF Transcript_8911/g.27048 Transcript_8911/m.27048 type:complete len:249 (-) Transcript_8911:127-873(-)